MIGVILCVPADVSTAVAVEMRRQLTLRFPGVEFAVVPATHALSFEYQPNTHEGAPDEDTA